MNIEIDPENADLFDGFGNGSLHLCFLPGPKNRISDDPRKPFYIELDFHSSDWDALFIDALHFPGWNLEGDDAIERNERNWKKFEQATPEYPMLTRISDMYEDYVFTLEELPQLLNECLNVRSKTSNPKAIKALRKLIFACTEASKRGFHLLFSCD